MTLLIRFFLFGYGRLSFCLQKDDLPPAPHPFNGGRRIKKPAGKAGN
jgi:hypothetical protein